MMSYKMKISLSRWDLRRSSIWAPFRSITRYQISLSKIHRIKFWERVVCLKCTKVVMTRTVKWRLIRSQTLIIYLKNKVNVEVQESLNHLRFLRNRDNQLGQNRERPCLPLVLICRQCSQLRVRNSINKGIWLEWNRRAHNSWTQILISQFWIRVTSALLRIASLEIMPVKVWVTTLRQIKQWMLGAAKSAGTQAWWVAITMETFSAPWIWVWDTYTSHSKSSLTCTWYKQRPLISSSLTFDKGNGICKSKMLYFSSKSIKASNVCKN